MVKKRKPMSEEQKERMRVLMKERWAAKKAAETNTVTEAGTVTPESVEVNVPADTESFQTAHTPQAPISSGVEFMDRVIADTEKTLQRVGNLFGVYPEMAELRKAHDGLRDSLYWLHRTRGAIDSTDN